MSYSSDYYDSYGYPTVYGALACYGSIRLTQTSPPQSFTEVLTLGDVKSYLKVPERSPTDGGEDDLLIALIVAAREQAELAQRRDVVPKQYDLSFDYWNSRQLELGDPLHSVDLFQYRDSSGAVTVMTENTDYIVDTQKRPGIVTHPYGTTWPLFSPWPSSAILLRFTSGFTASDPWWQDSGATVKNGMRLLISDWWNHRLPLETGRDALNAYSMAVRVCLGAGSVPSVR